MQKVQLTLREKCYIQSLQPVLENDHRKILSNLNILIVITREHRRPDIVYNETQKSKCQIINVATPSDQKITMKQQQKIGNY